MQAVLPQRANVLAGRKPNANSVPISKRRNPLHQRNLRQCNAVGIDLEQVASMLPATDPEQMTQGVYITLGLTLVSFVLTFGVAPRFKDSFKESDAWRDIYAGLMDMGGVQSIEPREAAARAQKGSVLMDIRMARKFEQGAMQFSQNFPLYQPISGFGLAANIRRAGFAFFGIYGTERNNSFIDEVEAAVPKGKEIIVACDTGGSMENKPGVTTGFQSQSLKAAYYLKKAGYKVVHMKGGVDEYRRSVAPLVDMDELKAPASSRQPVSIGSLFGR